MRNFNAVLAGCMAGLLVFSQTVAQAAQTDGATDPLGFAVPHGLTPGEESSQSEPTPPVVYTLEEGEETDLFSQGISQRGFDQYVEEESGGLPWKINGSEPKKVSAVSIE